MQVARASIILGDLGAAVPVYDMANLVLGAYAGDQAISGIVGLPLAG